MYAQGQVSGSLEEEGKRRSKRGSFLYFIASFSKVHRIYPLATVQIAQKIMEISMHAIVHITPITSYKWSGVVGGRIEPLRPRPPKLVPEVQAS